MINPNTSKNLPRWEPIITIALLLEFVLFPFTVFCGIDEITPVTLTIERCIDAVWLVNSCMQFMLARETDEGLEERFTVISVTYIKSDFFFDLVPLATAFTIQWVSLTYIVRILRLKRLNYMRRLIRTIFGRFGDRYELTN